jgi:hypothetical protein
MTCGLCIDCHMHVSGMTLSAYFIFLKNNIEREPPLIDSSNTSDYDRLILIYTMLLSTILSGHCLPYPVARTLEHLPR